MAGDAAVESDKSIGLAVVLGALAVAGALAMLAAPSRVGVGLGFAAAMTFGAVLVVALHVYE